jgi:hypothetical protein
MSERIRALVACAALAFPSAQEEGTGQDRGKPLINKDGAATRGVEGR